MSNRANTSYVWLGTLQCTDITITGGKIEVVGTNTIYGQDAGDALTSGINNTLIGYNSGINILSGSSNVCVGDQAGNTITTGGGNICMGPGAGGNITTGSNNIVLTVGNSGLAAGDSGKISIGFGTAPSTKTFIDAIVGTTTDVNDAIGVLIDSSGQLGTVSSSQRFKENIKTIDKDYLNNFWKLNAVSFDYISSLKNIKAKKEKLFSEWFENENKKKIEWNKQQDKLKQNDKVKYTETKFVFDEKPRKEFGLIAEEVLELYPNLVVRNKKGEIQTVQYHKLFGLLIGAIQENRNMVNRLLERYR